MAVQSLLTNWAALYFSKRRMGGVACDTSVVQLRDGCHRSLTGDDLLQGTEGNHERDVRLPIAGHVRAAVRKGGGVDGDFQGATSVASTYVSNEDVVVHGRFFCGFSFFQVFTSSKGCPLETVRRTSTLMKASHRLVVQPFPLYGRFLWSNHASLGDGWGGFYRLTLD